MVGKEENAGYQHFFLFPQCFQKAFAPVHQKSSKCIDAGQPALSTQADWIETL